MTDSLLFAGILLMAFAGSLHCIAMCGGMAMASTFAVPEAQRAGPALWRWQILFGCGRVLTYTLLGAVAGLVGAVLSIPAALQGLPLLLSAVIMVLLALYLVGRSAGLRAVENLGRPVWRRLQPRLKHLMPVDRPHRALLLGMAWGLLPCGMVYAALALSLGAASPLASAALMAVFGLVTVPSVAAAGVVGGTLTALRGPRGRHVAAGLALAMAGIFGWQAVAANHSLHADPLSHGTHAPHASHEHYHH